MSQKLSFAQSIDQSLSAGWGWSTLGEVANVLAGNPAPQGDEFFSEGKYPFVRVQDMGRLAGATRLNATNDYINDKAAKRLRLFPKGSVLFTKSGASTLLNQRAILGKDMYIVSHVAAAIPKDDVLSEWLYYWLRTVDFAYLAHATTLPSLPLSKAKAIPVPVAPLDQQKRIVAEIEKQFSRLDEAVANLKRVKANLKRYKAAILKAAVEGRLVETEAELARKKIPSPLAGEGGGEGEGASYETGEQLLQRILETRRSQWKGKGKYKEPAVPDITDLPKLPEGWVWATAEQLGHVQLGRQRSPKNRSKDYPVKYIRAANITEAGLNLTDVLDMEFLPVEQERYRLRRGDLLLSEASGSPAQVGKPAVWQDQLPLCCFQNTVIRLRGSIELSPYLLTCFQNYYVNGVFAKVASGVGINHLSADKFSRVQVPVPPLAEQYRIVTEVDRRLSFVREVETQVDINLQRTERLRQSILNRAFSGKLIQSSATDESGS